MAQACACNTHNAQEKKKKRQLIATQFDSNIVFKRKPPECRWGSVLRTKETNIVRSFPDDIQRLNISLLNVSVIWGIFAHSGAFAARHTKTM